jgi:diguanylate cyclase (GGDEF)-like protein
MIRLNRPAALLKKDESRPVAPEAAPLPASVRVTIALVGAAGLACVVVGLTRLTNAGLPRFAALMALAILTSTVKIHLPLRGGGSTLAISYIVNVLALLIVGPWFSAVIAAIGAWSQSTFRVAKRNPWYQVIFNMGTLAVSAVCAGLAHDLVASALAPAEWSGAAAIAATATVYFLVNSALVGFVIAASARRPVAPIWQREFLWSAPSYYVGAAIAYLAVELAQNGRGWWAAVFAVPAYLIFHSYRTYTDRLREEQRQTLEASEVQLALIEALAQAIEAKDSTSHDHLDRMQIYAEGLARALGMDESEIRGVRTATLLHDIGNLAVPERILSKPGPLSYEEFDRLKTHPRAGAEILSSVPFPYPVTPLVLSHHERWDGRGYPAGLKGEDIPYGARVIAVVDCFTSMLVERPFRPARTAAEAIATLRENRGSALDPAVVDRFIEILPSLETRWHESQRTHQVSGTAGDATVPSSVLSDISVTHREEQLLRDIAQTLSVSLQVSDALSFISSKLVGLVPVESCALFRLDPASGLFLCSAVVGPQRDVLSSITGSTVQSLEDLSRVSPSARTGSANTPQSAMVAPLSNESGIFGALAVYHSGRNAFGAGHRALFEQVATHTASVIANAIVFEETQEQSLTDALTGLPNRRYFERHLSQEIARVRRHGGQLSVLLLDMEGFKRVNDEFGHQAGDQALVEVAHVLREGLRVYDICARLAGDEFVLVLGNCDAAQAETRRTDIQRAVGSTRFEAVPGHVLQLSVSAGAATFPGEGETEASLIALADRRMYANKAARRLHGSESLAASREALWH